MNRKLLFYLLLIISIFSFKLNVYAEEEITTEEETNTLIAINDSVKYTNEETNYTLYLNDYADLFTDSEEEKLLEEMKPLTTYGHIMVETINENEYLSTSEYASHRYHETFYQESGTLFLIDMDNRYIYIFSDGENYKYITNNKADIITDNIYRYARDGNYYECASVGISQINTILSGGKILEPMRYASNIFLALLISFFVNFIIVSSATKIKKASDDAILNNCDIAFTVSNIVGTKTGTHRVYSPPSDSGGSSGGGGGGGGGGSSGGGGGHGF